MVNRWLVVAIAVLPIGMAVAEYGNTEPQATMAAAEGDLLAEPVQLAESSLERARQSLRALMLAHRNAHRDGDLLLATCLQALVEQTERLMPEATAHVGAAHAAKNQVDASAVRSAVSATSEKLDAVLDAAAACVGADEGSSDGVTAVEVTGNDFDPASGGTDVGLDGLPTIKPPSVPPAADGPDTVTTFDPADDMPMVPNTASPMR